MKNILVIGGTGYIGFHLLKKLSNYKVSLSSISLHPLKKKRKIKNVTYFICDYRIKSRLKNIDKNFDYIINAGGYFYSNKKLNLKENYNHHYTGLRNITDHFSSKNIKKFLHLGSSIEYGSGSKLFKETAKCKPSTDYGKIKLMCTKYLIGLYKKDKYPICVVRLSSIYGGLQKKGLIFNLLKFIKNKSKEKFIIDYKLLDFCHIDDIVYGLLKLLFSNKSKGEILNLGSGNLISTKQIKEYIEKKINKSKYMTKNIKIKHNRSSAISTDISKVKKVIKWRPKKIFLRELDKSIIKNKIL